MAVASGPNPSGDPSRKRIPFVPTAPDSLPLSDHDVAASLPYSHVTSLCRRHVALLAGVAVAVVTGSAAAAAQSLPSFRVGHAVGTSAERLGVGRDGDVDRVDFTWVEAGWRLRGEAGWRARLHGPSVGVGVVHLAIDSPTVYGSPTALYGFLRWPVVEGETLELRLDAALGLAAGWVPFDPISNPRQRAIGSRVNAMSRIAPSLALRVGRAWSVTLGIQGSHYSNGSLKEPNGGLSVFAPALGVEWGAGGVSATRRVSAADSAARAGPRR